MSISEEALIEFSNLGELCRSDSLSEDALRKIIENHGYAPNNDPKNINNYEFFHRACRNERVTEGILLYLLEYFPNAVRYADEDRERCLPLHSILCQNKNITLNMVQLLIDAFPDSLRHENKDETNALHALCINYNMNDKEGGLKILKFLLERCPESVRHAARDGILPIHIAAMTQSPEFCRVLIEAYPGSERITAIDGTILFHLACGENTVATAKYLYYLYPGSINVADNDGMYPIHHAITRVQKEERFGPTTADEMTQFLLDCNPNVALQKQSDRVPFLHLYQWMNVHEYDLNENPSRLDECLKVLQLLYDAHPDVIEDNEVISNVGGSHVEVQIFINTQLAYARQARDRTLMTTRDDNGQLPLHKALRDDVIRYDFIPLGSIKLLIKGNPSAISCTDNRGMIPLHLACQNPESTTSVVEYLIKLDPTSLRVRDFNDNTALHYACRTANHAVIALLTEKYGAVSVSKRNAHGQLPIDLLFSRRAYDREGVEYTESIFRLLRAYPAMMNCIPDTATTSHPDSKMSGKKRKIDNIQEEGEGYYSYLSSVRRKLIQTFWGR